VAKQRVREALGRVAQSRSADQFKLDLETVWQQYDWLPPNKAKILGGGTQDVISALNLSRMLYTGGRIRANVDAAASNLMIETENARRVQQEVIFGVVRAYYNVLRAQQSLKANEEAVIQVQQHLEIARRRLQVGKAAKLDVLRAEVQFANVQQALIRGRNDLRLARIGLHNAMGLDSTVPIEIVNASIPSGPETLSLESALSQAYQSRPEWRRNEMELRKTEAEYRSARAEFSPALSMVGSYNYEGGHFPPDIKNWNVGLVLTIPVSDGGSSRANAMQAKARKEQTLAMKELLRQKIALEVESALLSLEEASDRIETTAKSVEQAREAVQIAQEKYRVGMGSGIEVLDAQVALTQAETNALQAVFDRAVAKAQLELAIGKDREETP